MTDITKDIPEIMERARRLADGMRYIQGEIPYLLDGDLQVAGYAKKILTSLRKEMKDLTSDVAEKHRELKEAKKKIEQVDKYTPEKKTKKPDIEENFSGEVAKPFKAGNKKKIKCTGCDKKVKAGKAYFFGEDKKKYCKSCAKEAYNKKKDRLEEKQQKEADKEERKAKKSKAKKAKKEKKDNKLSKDLEKYAKEDDIIREYDFLLDEVGGVLVGKKKSSIKKTIQQYKDGIEKVTDDWDQEKYEEMSGKFIRLFKKHGLEIEFDSEEEEEEEERKPTLKATSAKDNPNEYEDDDDDAEEEEEEEDGDNNTKEDEEEDEEEWEGDGDIEDDDDDDDDF